MQNLINLALYPWQILVFLYAFYFPLWLQTQNRVFFVIQDLFEAISSGRKSSRALAGELLQIMTCNLVNTLKHKDRKAGIRPLHMWPCALSLPHLLRSHPRD